MPCSDGGYAEEYRRDREDMLARIACAALTELERLGQEDFLLLSNDEVREWWADHKEFDRQRLEQERQVAELKRRKQAALDKLSDEEKLLLGVK